MCKSLRLTKIWKIINKKILSKVKEKKRFFDQRGSYKYRFQNMKFIYILISVKLPPGLTCENCVVLFDYRQTGPCKLNLSKSFNMLLDSMHF